MEVPKPTSRVEIVAAMRRIRVSDRSTNLCQNTTTHPSESSVRIQSEGGQEASSESLDFCRRHQSVSLEEEEGTLTFDQSIFSSSSLLVRRTSIWKKVKSW